MPSAAPSGRSTVQCFSGKLWAAETAGREQEHGPASLAGGGLLGVFSREL